MRRRWIVAALMVIGAALRLYHLGYKSLWVDEANLYFIARGGLAQVLYNNSHGNSAPPLFALALALVSHLGDSEAALRSISLAAGVAALPILYLLGRELVGETGGWFAMLLATLSPGQLLYSQQVREYSLAVLFTALIALLFARFLRRPSRRLWIGLTASLSLGLFVQYGIALLAVALNAVVALEWAAGRVRWSTVWRWGLAQLPALAAAALVVRLSLSQQFDPQGFGAYYLGRGYWDGSWASLSRLVTVNTYEIFFLAYPTALLLELLVIVGTVYLWRRPQQRMAVLLFAAPMLATLAAAGLRYYPYIGMRQCLFLTVMIYVLAGAGLQWLLEVERRGVIALVATSWLVVRGAIGAWEHLQSVEPFHIRPAVELLQAQLRPGDRIYVYHGARSPFRYYDRAAGHVVINGVRAPGDPDAHRREVDGILAAPGRVWFVMTTCRAGECELLRDEAGKQRQLAQLYSDGGAELYLAE